MCIGKVKHYLILILNFKSVRSQQKVLKTLVNAAGQLMNTAFEYARKVASIDCFIFHDVDVIAEDDRILYACRGKGIGSHNLTI